MKYLPGCGCDCGYYTERPKFPHKPKKIKKGYCIDCKYLKWVIGLGMEPYCKEHGVSIENHWATWCLSYKRKWWKVWK